MPIKILDEFDEKFYRLKCNCPMADHNTMERFTCPSATKEYRFQSDNPKGERNPLIIQVAEDARKKENEAWLRGERCEECGGEKKDDGLGSMCGRCYGEA